MMSRLKAATLISIAYLTLACVGNPAATADVVNGGFESNGGVGTSVFTGWTVVNETGSFVPSSWYVQAGTASPITATPVPPPPQGNFAAMTDQGGPGSHVLYQDFVVPVGVTSATLTFQRYINNQAGAFSSPASLDFNTIPNQQARVDIITTTANVFSVASGDVLQNVFQTNPGDPLVSGYSLVTANLTSLLQADAGRTLRLRFAEADNQLLFNFGVDDVHLNITTGAAVPEPCAMALAALGGLMTAPVYLRSRRRSTTLRSTD
jgi:hypothetical protein